MVDAQNWPFGRDLGARGTPTVGSAATTGSLAVTGDIDQCGHTAAANRKTQAVCQCTACEQTNGADANGARNILALRVFVV